jgi:hypothetical protein
VTVTRTVPSRAAQQVTEFLARFIAGNWEEVLEDFGDFMRQRVGADRLASGWAHLIGMFGRYEGMGEVSPVSVGDGTVVDILVRFEAGEAMVWSGSTATARSPASVSIHRLSPSVVLP